VDNTEPEETPPKTDIELDSFKKLLKEIELPMLASPWSENLPEIQVLLPLTERLLDKVTKVVTLSEPARFAFTVADNPLPIRAQFLREIVLPIFTKLSNESWPLSLDKDLRDMELPRFK